VLIAPVGKPGAQRLMRYRRIETADKAEWVGEALEAVSFVPLLGGFV
jgi:protein-L-isoaspartate O-methyltransferase